MSNQARVLVVDDEAIGLKVLSNYVEQAGFEAVCEESGESAWARLQKDANFKVIVLDRIMPGLDGLALFEKIKSNAVLQKIPVLMLTAVDDHDAIVEAVSAGVFDYITKPVDRSHLFALLQAAASR